MTTTDTADNVMYPLWLRVSVAGSDPDTGFHARALHRYLDDGKDGGADDIDELRTQWTALRWEPVVDEPEVHGLLVASVARLVGMRMELTNVPQEFLENTLTMVSGAARIEVWGLGPVVTAVAESGVSGETQTWVSLTMHHCTKVHWDVAGGERPSFSLAWMSSPAPNGAADGQQSVFTMRAGTDVPEWCVAD